MKLSVFLQRRSWFIGAIGLIAAGVLVYLNSFSGVFIFDDQKAIKANPRIQSLWPIWNALSPPEDTPLRDRPVVNLTLALNYAIGRYDIRSYHALNLAIHLLAALALFGILRRTLLRPSIPAGYRRAAAGLSFSASLLWLVHPLQTESVTYIFQRSESLCGLFYLLTLYCFIRGTESRSFNLPPRNVSKRSVRARSASPNRSSKLDYYRQRKINFWYIGSIIFCALGMGTKAVMVTAPLLVLLYDVIFISPSLPSALKRRPGFYAALSMTWLIQLGLVLTTSYRDLRTFSIPEYALSQFGVIAHYLRLSFWPHPLCLDYGWRPPQTAREVILPALFIITLLGITARGMINKRPWVYGAVWFFLILAPTSSFLPLEDLAFEHRMYLPLAGVSVLAVTGVYGLFLKIAPARPGLALGLFVVTAAALLGFLTVSQNELYRAPLELWSRVSLLRPQNPRARYNLGQALSRTGRTDRAIESYRRAIRLKPDYAEAYNNLGNDLLRQGKTAEALNRFRQALRINPEYAEAFNNLGLALSEAGKLEEAKRYLSRALRLQPELAETRFNLGNVFLKENRPTRAIDQFERALELRPDYPAAHFSLGFALEQEGRPEEAAGHYRRAIEIEPDHAPAHNNLGNILSAGGKPESALRHYRRAIESRPDYVEAYYNLGAALVKLGKIDQARTCFKAVLRIDPGHRPARRALAQTGDKDSGSETGGGEDDWKTPSPVPQRIEIAE